MRELRIGAPAVVEAAAPRPLLAVVFEDDGETGYLYAVDRSRPDGAQILDAVAVYVVSKVPDRQRRRALRIRWLPDGSKAALYLDGEPQAVFDFAATRGYARSNFPPTSRWSRGGHAWADSALAGF